MIVRNNDLYKEEHFLIKNVICTKTIQCNIAKKILKL